MTPPRVLVAGLGNIFLGPAHRIIIAAMRSAFDAHGNIAAGELGFVELVRHGTTAFRWARL